ncbi:hypothetical protein GGI43DRAFT_382296 [Trichoderma evansii]
MLLLSILVALLLGIDLTIGLNNAQPNLDIWDIDASCTPHRSALQKAYNDVAVMAAKALRDIQFVQQPRPSHLQDQIEWGRIARAFENMFGFKPGDGGTDLEDKYFKKVSGVYERMNKALYDNVKYPTSGFSGLHDKALWMCGDTSWRWYTKEMNNPYITPTRPLYISRSNIFEVAAGAWVHKQRFITNGDPRGVDICRPNVFASTQVKYDIITFCDFFFSDKVTSSESPVDGRNSVVEGKTHLDHFGNYGPSRIMFQELVHWYGSEVTALEVKRLIDEQAVSADGEQVWAFTNAVGKIQLTTTSKKQPGIRYTPLATYGYARCSRLARSHLGSEFAQNCGPAMATGTAETYAYFAMMAYLDNFDWSGDGIAKRIDRNQ